VKDHNGCSAITSVSITNSNPQSLSSTPASAKICAGSSVNINVNGALSYSWSPTSGLDDPTASTVIASPTTTTTYTVTGADAHGCTVSLTIPMTVYKAPDITINPAHPALCTGWCGGAECKWCGNLPMDGERRNL